MPFGATGMPFLIGTVCCAAAASVIVDRAANAARDVAKRTLCSPVFLNVNERRPWYAEPASSSRSARSVRLILSGYQEYLGGLVRAVASCHDAQPAVCIGTVQSTNQWGPP